MSPVLGGDEESMGGKKKTSSGRVKAFRKPSEDMFGKKLLKVRLSRDTISIVK